MPYFIPMLSSDLAYMRRARLCVKPAVIFQEDHQLFPRLLPFFQERLKVKLESRTRIRDLKIGQYARVQDAERSKLNLL